MPRSGSRCLGRRRARPSDGLRRSPRIGLFVGGGGGGREAAAVTAAAVTAASWQWGCHSTGGRSENEARVGWPVRAVGGGGGERDSLGAFRLAASSRRGIPCGVDPGPAVGPFSQFLIIF